jgi:hypothetical protein
MKFLVRITIFLCSGIPFISDGQDFSKRSLLGKKYANEQVEAIHKIKKGNHSSQILVKNKINAVSIAEPILFSTYGKENIIRQRPYEIYLINGSWYIGGTLPKDEEGGTFEIIIESTNGRVLSLTHSK